MDFIGLNSAMMKNILGDLTPQAQISIRTAVLDDADQILEMHTRLSDDSIYKRYHMSRTPSRQEVEKILQLGNSNGKVLVAAVPGHKPKIVGMAFYVEVENGTAETAFLVEDLYQGQGIGRRLLNALSRIAKDQDICFFNARVLATNRPMIHLLNDFGRLVNKQLDYGALEMKMDICGVSG